VTELSGIAVSRAIRPIIAASMGAILTEVVYRINL
jgi:hypothetical protein